MKIKLDEAEVQLIAGLAEQYSPSMITIEYDDRTHIYHCEIVADTKEPTDMTTLQMFKRAFKHIRPKRNTI